MLVPRQCRAKLYLCNNGIIYVTFTASMSPPKCAVYGVGSYETLSTLFFIASAVWSDFLIIRFCLLLAYALLVIGMLVRTYGRWHGLLHRLPLLLHWLLLADVAAAAATASTANICAA